MVNHGAISPVGKTSMIRLLKNTCSMKSNIYSVILGAFAAVLISSCNGGSDTTPKVEDSFTPELTHLRKAIALRPDSVGLRYLLMDELLKNKLYAEAIAQND